MRKELMIIMLAVFMGAQAQNTKMMFSDESRIDRPYAKDPFVLKVKGQYLMYYSIPASSDGKKGWGIGIARSADLTDWTKIGEVNPATPLEQKGICAPCALLRNDTIHLFYQTYGNGATDAICHAWSVDGVRFERNATNPVFRPTGDWNCGRAIDAEVFLYKGKYFLYYATRDKAYQKQMLGVAVAKEGCTFNRECWSQACTEPILKPELLWEGNCIEAASVIKRNGKLYMFYAGNYNNSPQQIGVAESMDGIRWNRCSDEPFLPCGDAGEWNSSESGHPGIFDDGKESYLFYQGNADKGQTWWLSQINVKWDKRGPKRIASAEAKTDRQTSAFGDLGNGQFRNPVIPADYSDPDVIRVGDDYYGIASTFCFSPGMIIYHSKDLVNWEMIGHVVGDISFLNAELNWNQMKGYYNGIWAGSLRHHDGLFYCHFTTPRGGWFVATIKDIRGKWEVKAMKDRNGQELRGRGWDDNCPLWDDDGQAYIVASNFGRYWFPHLYKMSDDGVTLLDAMIDPECDKSKNIDLIGGYVTKPNRTAEASKMYKWNGMYYFYFSEVREIHGNKVRVPVMLRSKNIYGPYEERLLMHSQGKKVDGEPNQGTIIDTPDGKWYFVTQHGTGDFDGRVLSVVPVTWKDGWPLIGEDIDNDGVGEMVWETEKPVQNQPKYKIQTSDNFSDDTLAPQWEWNHQPRADKWSLTEREGFIREYAYPQLHKDDFFSTGNVLSQRYIRWKKGCATVRMDIDGMTDGQVAGLTIFNGGRDHSFLAVEMKDGIGQWNWQKKQAKDKETDSMQGKKLPKGTKTVWFRTEISFDGQAVYSWSLNGRRFYPFGKEFQLAWGNYRGCRIGLFTYNNVMEEGMVDFADFRYESR